MPYTSGKDSAACAAGKEDTMRLGSPPKLENPPLNKWVGTLVKNKRNTSTKETIRLCQVTVLSTLLKNAKKQGGGLDVAL